MGFRGMKQNGRRQQRAHHGRMRSTTSEGCATFVLNERSGWIEKKRERTAANLAERDAPLGFRVTLLGLFDLIET